MTTSISRDHTLCGVTVPLIDYHHNYSVVVSHDVPEEYKDNTKQRYKRDNCDVVISLGERTFYGHKNLLIARIPFFKSLFKLNMLESSTGKINFSINFCGFDFDTIENLLHYTYNGKLTITEANVQGLTLASSYLRMGSVTDECAEFINKRINEYNVLSIMSFYKSINYGRIDDHIFLEAIDKFIVPISLTPEFRDLSIDDLVEFLQRDSLNIDNEEQVFYAITRWMGDDIDKRQYAAKLLSCVRCARLSQSFITNTIEKTEWVMGNIECLSIVNELKGYPPLGKDKTLFKDTQRVCDDSHRLVFAIGVDSMQLYNPISNTWTKSNTWKEVHTKRPYYGSVVVVDHKMYLFGGSGCSGVCFDTITNTWSSMTDMTIKRVHFATGVINGKIYVAGGSTSRENWGMGGCNFFESYDTCSQTWSSLSPMHSPRVFAASSVHQGKFYVMGGFGLSRDAREDVEVYDPQTDSWTLVNSMTYDRIGASAVTFKGQIYIVGGFNGTYHRTMERYDPPSNTWTTLKSMKQRRFLATLVVSCGKIFVLGGVQNRVNMIATNMLTAVEIYDPEMDIWVNRAPLSEYSFNFGTLPVPASFSSSQALILFHNSMRLSQFGPQSFQELAIFEYGFVEPTEVQSECLPEILNRKDLLCQVNSGSGKTTLFIISTLQLIEPKIEEVSILVICHSGALAIKIKNEYLRLSKYLHTVKIAAFTGENSFDMNKNELNNSSTHIAIGTPARIQALFKCGVLKLDKIKHIILDECDRLISNREMRSCVENILTFCPNEKQVMIFTSISRRKISLACEKYLRNTHFKFVRP